MAVLRTKQNQTRTKRRGYRYWQAQIEKLAESGLTVSEYCNKHRIKNNLLYKWRSRINAERKLEGKRAESKRFVELPLPIRTPHIDESYDIYPGPTPHIRTGSSFNREKLKELIEILRGL